MASPQSTDVVWQRGRVDRDTRWRRLGRRGATVWFTGLPASGKSTVAGLVEAHLVDRGLAAYRLDGDNLRHGLCGDLGFGAADRAENVRRAAHVAALLADAGEVAIVSLVSPYAADRALARQIHDDADLDFLEVYVNTPLEECERRDPKGMYVRARAGEIVQFTGISDPYEPPVAPDVELYCAAEAAAAAAARVLDVLAARGVAARP
jgi:adenylyl-sulfate kinase